MNVTSTNRIGVPQFNSAPCEGAEDITLDLRFDTEATQNVDLSQIQGVGKWSGVQTLYIDNSENTSPIYIETAVARQKLTVPPLSCWLMPVVVPNPPKFTLVSAGGIIVRMNILNYFFPPCVWSPTSGGGTGGGAGRVNVTNLSAASPVVIPANANRTYLLICNPAVNAAIMTMSIAGGGNVEIPIGGTYETGPSCPMGAITLTVAAGNVVAYEGEPV